MDAVFAARAAQMLNALADEAHHNAVEHGFYRDISGLEQVLRYNGDFAHADNAARDFVLAQIAKISGECGEAVAAIQHSEGDSALAEELADVIIRTLDLAAYLDADIGRVLIDKMERNERREYLHGKTC